MGVRVGADVGGTFTKAVAIDSVTGELAGRAVVPTTHDHRDGVSAGVVDVVAKLVAEVGAESIELVTHSTTQAVNALLEGDTVPVGVLGMARPPYLRKARNRTTISRAIAHEFLDLSAGFDAGVAREALIRLADAGAQAVCVADPTLDVRGEAILVNGSAGEGALEATIGSVVSRHVRTVGPIRAQPTTWVIQDGRIRELTDPNAIADTVGTGAAAVIVGCA